MLQRTKQSPAPLNTAYLLTGEDEFRKTLSLAKLKEKFLGKSPDSFSYDLFYGKESRAGEVIRSLETFSLTGSRRLVVLKDPQLLADDEKKALLNYLKKPCKGNNLLVLFAGKPSGKRDKFHAEASKYTKVFDFGRLKPDEISSWVVSEFKKRGKVISRSAAELISESCQADMGRISAMVEELSIYAGKRPKVAEDDIAQFSDMPIESSTFKLLDSINDKDACGALRIMKGLLRSESNASQIIGLLSWHISRLITIKKLILRNIPKNEMFSHVKAGTYILNKLVNQAGNFSLRQLKKDMQLLLDTDLMIKRSSLNSEFLLEMLVIRLSS